MADRPLQSLSIEGLNDTYVNTPLSTASTFDTSITYAIGDYTFYNRKLYKFISEHAAGEWNSNDVVEITIGDELKNKINVPNTAEEKAAIKGILDIVEEGVTAIDTNSDGNVVLDTTAGLSNEYVKKTDYATSSTAGVTMINNNFGVQIDNITPQYLRIYPAAAADIKSASNSNFCTYRPITPLRQHQAVFYGLTKAAGVDMASSTNEVGTYTNEAKVAIQKMLGIYEAPWELIREDTFTNETEADYVITVDGNGDAFELTDMVLMFETPVQDRIAGKSSQVQLVLNNVSYNQIRMEPGSWTQNANSQAHGFYAVVKQHDGFVETYHSYNTVTGNPQNLRFEYFNTFSNLANQRVNGTFLISEVYGNNVNKIYITSINLLSVTGKAYYKLYGKRKWTI